MKQLLFLDEQIETLNQDSSNWWSNLPKDKQEMIT